MSELHGNTSVTEAEHREHQYNLSAKRVTNVGSDKQELIDIVSSTLIYIGSGARGLATSADGWLLEKIDMSSNPYIITHAIDTYDNHLTATYS